jgi:4-hydroxy 2-oxovalerate aldolase
MVKLLDCTLRDGSYMVDFGFTEADTYDAMCAISFLDMDFVEIGHGVGVGAQPKYGVAGATDEQYMAAASRTEVDNWGMFCIPGVGSLSDINKMKEYGAKFVRIGCDVNKVDQAREYIEHAKNIGMTVFSNLMKSYASSPGEFAVKGRLCLEWGANYLYVVDSAGCMAPHDIVAYASEIWNLVPEAKLGFHGHNNIGLAVANALLCEEIGFEVIDVTLQGIGRGGGNVPTEQFVSSLHRSGIGAYNILDILDAGTRIAGSISAGRAMSHLDVVCGYCGFHSSYIPAVLRVAKERRVDPRMLILRLSHGDLVDITDEDIDYAASTMQPSSVRVDHGNYYGEEHK